MDELPYRAACGVWGSYACVFICFIGLVAQFYVALYPVGGTYLDPDTFFQLYLAGPLLIFLYLCWKAYSWFYRPADRPIWIKIHDIDVYTGMREAQRDMISGEGVTDEQRRTSIQELQEEKQQNKGVMGRVKGVVRSII